MRFADKAARIERIQRELDEALARRKAARHRRSTAAQAGASTKIQRSAQRTRELFPQQGTPLNG